MPNEEIKAGALVQLKSGGPVMTVLLIGDFNTGRAATCIWFPSNDAKPFEWNFPFAALALIPA